MVSQHSPSFIIIFNFKRAAHFSFRRDASVIALLLLADTQLEHARSAPLC